MAERTEQRATDDTTNPAEEGLPDDSANGTLTGDVGSPRLSTETLSDETEGGLRARAAGRSGEAARGFAVSLLVSALLWLVATAVLPGGSLAGFVGLLVAGFGLGLVGRQRYVELGVAGAVVGGGAALLDFVVLSVLGAGLVLVAAGAGIGLLAAVVGHYFGRDLRDGLTREV